MSQIVYSNFALLHVRYNICKVPQEIGILHQERIVSVHPLKPFICIKYESNCVLKLWFVTSVLQHM